MNETAAKVSKEKIATLIAIIFHAIGLAGFFWFEELFLGISWINMLLMFLLIIYTQQKITSGFIIFIVVCFITGMAVEMAGTNTGAIFGNYKYGRALGLAVYHVPLIIGINWVLIIYCCSTAMNMLSDNLHKKTAIISPAWLKLVTIVTDSAMLAVLFDWIMEPAAVKLKFWEWENGSIPFYNYVSWFVVSAILALVYYISRFPKQNKFAVNLLLIQAMFFLIIRSFL